MKKKILYTLLSVLIIGSCFTGCNKKEEEPELFIEEAEEIPAEITEEEETESADNKENELSQSERVQEHNEKIFEEYERRTNASSVESPDAESISSDDAKSEDDLSFIDNSYKTFQGNEILDSDINNETGKPIYYIILPGDDTRNLIDGVDKDRSDQLIKDYGYNAILQFEENGTFTWEKLEQEKGE